MSKSAPSKTPSEEIAVPFPRIAGLVRQLTHDVRNGLNNIDLQSAFLQEIVTEPQGMEEIKRLRVMVAETAKMLREFSARFWLSTPNFVTYSARMFIEDFHQRLARVLPDEAAQIQWTVALRDESVSVDLEMFSRGLVEYFKNAFQFREDAGAIAAAVRAVDGNLEIELKERKTSLLSSPDTWGLEPLVTNRRGGYGMGLFYARQVLRMHDAKVVAAFDSGTRELCTTLSVPLVVS
jgi:nitrogen-specific signal transduction histidine kinase